MWTIEHLGLHVTLRDEPTYTPASADNVRQYDREVHTSPGGWISSRHGVAVETLGEERTSCILLGRGGATGVHAHSAAAVGDTLYVACGNTVVALALPGLEPRWLVEADPATCFGVHLLPDGGGLIVHGELQIARLSFDGILVWRTGGADIFTGELRVEPPAVAVTDWDGVQYRFALADGRPLTPVL